MKVELLCTHQTSYIHIDGLVQERCNSSALAMELRLSCTNPSISSWDACWFTGFMCHKVNNSPIDCEVAYELTSYKMKLPTLQPLHCIHITSSIRWQQGTINNASTFAPGIGRESTQNQAWKITEIFILVLTNSTNCVANILSKMSVICNSQLFLCIVCMAFNVKKNYDFYNFHLFLSEFIPKPDGWICVSTFYHQSYWYCWWFLLPWSHVCQADRKHKNCLIFKLPFRKPGTWNIVA